MIHCTLEDLKMVGSPIVTHSAPNDLILLEVYRYQLVCVLIILTTSESTVLKRNIDVAGAVPKMTWAALASLAQPSLSDCWIARNDTLRD